MSISCINEALLQNEPLKKEILFTKKATQVSKMGKKKKSKGLESKTTAFCYREEWGKC